MPDEKESKGSQDKAKAEEIQKEYLAYLTALAKAAMIGFIEASEEQDLHGILVLTIKTKEDAERLPRKIWRFKQEDCA